MGEYAGISQEGYMNKTDQLIVGLSPLAFVLCLPATVAVWMTLGGERPLVGFY